MATETRWRITFEKLCRPDEMGLPVGMPGGLRWGESRVFLKDAEGVAGWIAWREHDPNFKAMTVTKTQTETRDVGGLKQRSTVDEDIWVQGQPDLGAGAVLQPHLAMARAAEAERRTALGEAQRLSERLRILKNIQKAAGSTMFMTNDEVLYHELQAEVQVDTLMDGLTKLMQALATKEIALLKQIEALDARAARHPLKYAED